MGNPNVAEWRIDKVEQFEEIHANALDICFLLREAAGRQIELQGSDIEKRAYFYNWFYEGFESTKNYHLRDDKYYVGPWTDFDHSHVDYGVVIGGMCLLGATWIKEMKKDTADVREDIEFYINYLQRLLGIYVGYHLAILVKRVRKRGSGKGQRDAMYKRIEAIENVILPFNKDGVIRMDRGEFCKLVNSEFKNSENYPRDRKTYKTYKELLETRNRIEIILEKGSFIPQ